MKKYSVGGAEYVSPYCDVITVLVERSILTTSGSLEDMGDNNIYTEDF